MRSEGRTFCKEAAWHSAQFALAIEQLEAALRRHAHRVLIAGTPTIERGVFGHDGALEASRSASDRFCSSWLSKGPSACASRLDASRVGLIVGGSRHRRTLPHVAARVRSRQRGQHREHEDRQACVASMKPGSRRESFAMTAQRRGSYVTARKPARARVSLRNLAQRVAGTGISQLNDWVAQMNERRGPLGRGPLRHLNTT